MQKPFISLLYPSAEARASHADPARLPRISEQVCDELGLTEIFDLKSGSLTEFFTSSEEVIRYRQSTFADLLSVPETEAVFSEVHPLLNDIRELRRLDDENTAADSYLYSISEIELYVSCIDTLAKGLAPLRPQMKSPALTALTDYVIALSTSEEHLALVKKLSQLSSHVGEVRSITVGVNLDREFRPETAGVLSVNAEPFKSGRALDKILRLSLRSDATTCIAPLSPLGKGQSENKQEALIGAFRSAIEDVFRSSVRGWRSIIGEYVLENTDFLLTLAPELEFIARASRLLRRLSAHPGCHIVYPRICPKEQKVFSARGLYNPRVALAIEGEIVTNDLAFDEKAHIYILTGPNRGGKSVITVALGAAQAMCQLGLPVPAEEAEISIADGIFTHFPEGADDTIDKGRLGEECARLREIFDAASSDSLILFDESLSSTGAYEATYIARETLTAFAALGCRGIFSTHLHDLAASAEEIDARSRASGGVGVDTLVAAISEGQRSFRILRKKPDGRSYAKDIADRYGLSFEELLSKKGAKGGKS